MPSFEGQKASVSQLRKPLPSFWGRQSLIKPSKAATKATCAIIWRTEKLRKQGWDYLRNGFLNQRLPYSATLATSAQWTIVNGGDYESHLVCYQMYFSSCYFFSKTTTTSETWDHYIRLSVHKHWLIFGNHKKIHSVRERKKSPLVCAFRRFEAHFVSKKWP